ncbi:MAG: hypothetical protein ACO3UU_05295 [Minisyncoccia bacterium]
MVDILATALGILFISFFTAYIITLKKLRDLYDQVSKMIILFNLMNDADIPKEDQDIHKENFIKFLSDSREWAFDYIENVQIGLSKFVEEIDPIVSYFDNYGLVVQGSPHYKDMIKISKEFKELKKFLPQDNNA